MGMSPINITKRRGRKIDISSFMFSHRKVIHTDFIKVRTVSVGAATGKEEKMSPTPVLAAFPSVQYQHGWKGLAPQTLVFATNLLEGVCQFPLEASDSKSLQDFTFRNP
jgi:hypothetical protein